MNEINTVNHNQQLNPTEMLTPFLGQRWLVEERDACGVGFIAYRDNRATHKLIEQALVALGCMEHRGGCSADRDSGELRHRECE